MKIALAIVAGVVLLLIMLTRGPAAGPTTTIEIRPERRQAIQEVAESALGDREGTIVVIDLQTARVRAVVNPHLAFQEAFPPGSTIKPFTALAALRAGVIDENSRTLCRERYTHEDVHAVCSHKPHLQPLNRRRSRIPVTTISRVWVSD